MDSTIRPVSNPEEAVQQFVGEQFMDWLVDFAAHNVKLWGTLELINQANPKPEKIKKFIMQRYLVSQAFSSGSDSEPGFLGFAVANLSESSDPLAERALEIIESTKQDELTAGGANKHKEQWAKLLSAIGLGGDDMKRGEPKEPTRHFIAELSDVYSDVDWQTTMAAYFIYQRLLPEESLVITTMLKNTLGLSASDVEIFSWYSKEAVRLAQETRRLLDQAASDEDGRQLILSGAQKQLNAQQDFYQALCNYLYE